MRTSFILVFLLTLGLVTSPGCTKKTDADAAKASALTPEQELVSRGRKTFMSQCLQCHNSDFNKDGALGPAIGGSSKELLEARLLNQSYPAGYTPKRASKIMPAMPYLKTEIDALAAYLASPPAAK